MIRRIGRLRGQLPQQLRGKSTFAWLHCPLSLMARTHRRNRRLFLTGDSEGLTAF